MNNIYDIRIVQYYRKDSEMYETGPGQFDFRDLKEFTHHKFQIKRGYSAANWEDIEVVEIEEE